MPIQLKIIALMLCLMSFLIHCPLYLQHIENYLVQEIVTSLKYNKICQTETNIFYSEKYTDWN